MAPLSTNAISHFLHPAHKLNYTTNTSSYVCDGCQVVGTGSRFTCTTCSFDLHDYCAKCPTRLTSSTSHQHPMSLVVHKSIPNLTESCRMCLYPIKGLAYQCKLSSTGTGTGSRYGDDTGTKNGKTQNSKIRVRQ
ncbi:putative Zinc finger, ZZ-type superfamily [Helianthus debilis subsp. tardiflorus]